MSSKSAYTFYPTVNPNTAITIVVFIYAKIY